MKKTKKTLLTAAALAAAFNMAACTSPVGDESTAADTTTKYEPSEAEVYGVYGPPEDYEDIGASSAEEQDSSDIADDVVSEYDPSEDEIYDVYGPPSDYDPVDDDVQTEYGPPDVYDPDDGDETRLTYEPPDIEMEPIPDIQVAYGPAPDY